MLDAYLPCSNLAGVPSQGRDGGLGIRGFLGHELRHAVHANVSRAPLVLYVWNRYSRIPGTQPKNMNYGFRPVNHVLDRNLFIFKVTVFINRAK